MKKLISLHIRFLKLTNQHNALTTWFSDLYRANKLSFTLFYYYKLSLGAIDNKLKNMLGIIGIVLIVGICVWLFGKKSDKGTNIKCDHCGHTFNLHKAGYDQFQLSGKKCPQCKECVNK